MTSNFYSDTNDTLTNRLRAWIQFSLLLLFLKYFILPLHNTCDNVIYSPFFQLINQMGKENK